MSSASSGGPRIVVMGVSGCGKSTLGRAVADDRSLPFIEGDDLHSGRNRQKMADGIALRDDAATERVRQRGGRHPFPASLVGSQFAALESPVGEAGVLRVDATAPLPELVGQVRRWLDSGAGG